MEDITSKLDNILKETSNLPNSGKPPNIVVYSECQSSAICLKETLSLVLEKQRYTVYILNTSQMLTAPWLNNVCLLVIAGHISPDITNRLKSYVTDGNGRLLCFGSNLLDAFVPQLSGAEVKDEMGLLTFSKWSRVEVMHRVLKYQFSDEKNGLESFSNYLPNSITLSNSINDLTSFEVTTFGLEENSMTPSFILLTSKAGGKTLFSNVHLEFDLENHGLTENHQNLFKNDKYSTMNYSNCYEHCKKSSSNSGLSRKYQDLSNGEMSDNCTNKTCDSTKNCEVLTENFNISSKNLSESFKNSNRIRIDIFAEILKEHFGLLCASERTCEPEYTVGYFFGDPASKRKFLKDLESRMSSDGVLKLKRIGVKFCVGDVPPPSPSLLPVLVDGEEGCGGEFSVKSFFDELKTRKLGRLGVFASVMTSSMHVVDTRLVDGFVVVPRSLTRGVGRGENVWLSPAGCALFSLQVHVGFASLFAGRLGLLQHCVTLAAVECVLALPGCQRLSLGLKWPNDIYADKRLKLGGAIASSIVGSREAVCNLGVGVNLFNRLPTTCINDMIDALNAKEGTRVEHLTLEKFVAILLNRFEQLIDMVERGRIDEVIQLYYKHWLHSGSKVSVRTEDGSERQVTIVGIDNCGFLKVVDKDNRQFSVHPDGNSFDMMSGLIAPKVL
ncbi:biotin--protein ligase [Nilaparvata lugens]|uniref:biotin--protein ligase n=1 Tax=Nilaparvata lugens TaxID=108931 RepID=UPI00193E4909|nr:biotin--protein ligase [Nilaparvata lugens]XP_022192173.2 biotin--protein ligase [Nilaparvata lugens]XP_039284481.1 biotin--protein ligase [Nilaparvata lugens]